MAQPGWRVGGGVRTDVPPPPSWMRRNVEAPLVACGLLPEGFVDSCALNMYHDGSEGIQVWGPGATCGAGWWRWRWCRVVAVAMRQAQTQP